MQAQVSEAAQTNRIEVRALVWRGGCQQFHALRRLVAVEGDRRANLGSLHGIPDGSVWKNLRSLRGELLRLGCIAAHRQRQGRTPQAARGLAIARQRVGTRIGFVEFGGDVPESPAQRCLRGPLVQFVRLTTLAMDIPVGPLQAEAEVLLRPACEPLNLPGDGRRIALDVGDCEEALVDPRSVDPPRPQFLR